MKRIVIGGCRYYNNYQVFKEYVDNCFDGINKSEIVILSGHCSGVDSMAELYAKQNNITLEIYPADWHKFGKSAGPRRNKQMVDNADCVIAFWDNQSRGTQSLINFAKESDKMLFVKDIS